jgi:CheY-like chemotaxis protein
MSGGRLRVLLVEDEAIPARAAAVMLDRLGCEVTSIVDTGQAAVTAASAQRPDLVLMDIRLKGPMDGIEAAARIRGRLGTPIVFVSAYQAEELGERRAALGEATYLTKPVDEQALAAAITRLVGSQRLSTDAPDEL